MIYPQQRRAFIHPPLKFQFPISCRTTLAFSLANLSLPAWQILHDRPAIRRPAYPCSQTMATHGAARFVYHQPSHSQTVYQESQDLMLQCTLPAKRRSQCQEGLPRTPASIGQRQSWQHFSFCGDSTRTIQWAGQRRAYEGLQPIRPPLLHRWRYLACWRRRAGRPNREMATRALRHWTLVRGIWVIEEEIAQS